MCYTNGVFFFYKVTGTSWRYGIVSDHAFQCIPTQMVVIKILPVHVYVYPGINRISLICGIYS